MSKRWTDKDLQQLRPGMVCAKKVIVPNSCTAPKQLADNQLKAAVQKKGKTASHALGRLPAGKMNKTEERYAQHLELQKSAGLVLWYAFEPMNLRLGVNCYYRIDFLVLMADHSLEVHEVKGKWEDDALVKIKVA